MWIDEGRRRQLALAYKAALPSDAESVAIGRASVLAAHSLQTPRWSAPLSSRSSSSTASRPIAGAARCVEGRTLYRAVTDAPTGAEWALRLPSGTVSVREPRNCADSRSASIGLDRADSGPFSQSVRGVWARTGAAGARCRSGAGCWWSTTSLPKRTTAPSTVSHIRRATCNAFDAQPRPSAGAPGLRYSTVTALHAAGARVGRDRRDPNSLIVRTAPDQSVRHRCRG
jgi:hypothetical protein